MENFTISSLPLIRRITSCPPNADNQFGPFVAAPCRQGFDFTLLFEETILYILPACVLLLWSPVRISRLWNSPLKTLSSPVSSAKTVTAVTYLALQIALLVLWSTDNTNKTNASVPAAVIGVLAGLDIVLLSRVEHSRSVRPSFILNVYLFFSLVFDITRARTLYLLQDDTPKASVFSAALGIKLALLFLESQGKVSYLRDPYRRLPPETVSGIWSQSTFWWLNELILRGFKKLLALEDLYELDVDLQSEVVYEKMNAAWSARTRPERKYELVPTILKGLKWPLLATVVPRICMIGFQFAQPFLISQAIEFLSETDDITTRNDGYGLIGATFLIYTGVAISNVHYQRRLYRSVAMFRGAMVSMIYNQALHGEADSFNESASISLMSTDVDRVASSLEDCHELYARSIEVIIGIALLARQLGWVCIMPLIVVGVSSFFSSLVGKRIGNAAKVWAGAVQKRIGITASCLGSMKSVKMLGYVRVVSQILQNQRVRELKLQKRFRWMIVWSNVISNGSFFITPPVVFLTYAIQAYVRNQGSLTVTQAFTSLALITLLSAPASRLLGAFPTTMAASGSVERIQTFLLTSPRKDTRVRLGETIVHQSSPLSATEDIPMERLRSNRSSHHAGIAVRVENANIKPSGKAEFALKSIDLTFRQSSMSVILGPVGSGKTTLLRSILGEVPCEQGKITVNSPHMAYCAQSAWLPNRTIQQIVTGSEKNNNIDIQWFDKVVHACDLASEIENLPRQDQTLVGSKGVILSGGQKQRLALARAIYARQPIILLDDVLSALDARTERKVVDRLLGKAGLLRQLRTTIILVTHTTRHLSLSDSVVILNADGTLAKQAPYKDLVSDPMLLKIKQSNEQHAEEEQENAEKGAHLPAKASAEQEDEQLKDLSRQTGDMTIYKYFFKHVSQTSLILYVVIGLCFTFTTAFPQVILKWWSEQGGPLSPQYLVPFCLLAVVAIVFCGANIWGMLVLIVPEASVGLHHTLLKAVMRAPQSFFTKTDRGKTLNRFSQDMTLIDGTLAIAFLVTSAQLLDTIAQAALIAVGSSWMALTIPFVLATLWALQYVYLRTSRQLRYLDLETKSPVYTQFVETLDGVATIRAFGWEQSSREVNFDRLNASQKPYYLLFCIQRWLNLVLDLVVMALAVILIAMAVSLRSSTSPGLLGISLNNVLGFNSSLSYLITSWTQLETSLGAIARVKNFEENTAIEAQPGENDEAPESWPIHGKIEIKNVSASYEPETKALDNISLSIKPGEKVGICGRTGSGKSTLLSTILRLLDMDTGSIWIDNIDLSTLNRESIREHLIAVPQDPFMLSGDVRLNADPLSAYSDDAIISALQKVRLWDILSTRGGLLCNLDTDPLSVGQSQLFCLARAILRSTSTNGTGHKILLLDEATSNVDLETDALMQEIIREEFASHTILSVAHRLETIMDADLIVVMENGRIIETGAPQALLRQENSAFAVLNGRHSP